MKGNRIYYKHFKISFYLQLLPRIFPLVNVFRNSFALIIYRCDID